jgi:acetyl esterase/lipase
MYRHARMLANRGYVVMAINYRLAPEYKWPAQIHDCKHAVRWIKEHAAEYNADPSKVYAYGYSAGGHLAALLATTNKDDALEGETNGVYAKHSSEIQGAIIGGSPLEFGWISKDSTALKYWLDATKGSAPKKYTEASPKTYVSNGDPAIVVYHGTEDSLVPTTSPEAFVEKCHREHVPSELFLTNAGHIGAFSNTTLFLKCLRKFEELIDKSEQK